ncbi:acyl-CoA dehydrogenase family protein [Actinomycetes bacterium KLBMP 9797]
MLGRVSVRGFREVAPVSGWGGSGEGTEAFRREVRAWLAANLDPDRDGASFAARRAFGRRLAAAGWNCPGWPTAHGGRGASLSEQVAFHEEYARAGAPPRVDHIGVTMVGPTLIDHGTPAQRARFLPRIAVVDELWCQGYSEPGAGSDLAAVATRARLDGDRWVLTGQKIWTSLAQVADWCFVLARTSPVPAGGPRQAGLSYLLVPMRQPGVTVRPIRQLTGESEFNEVFFDEARTDQDLVVGEVGGGWRIAMATLTYERGAATMGQQIGFQRELDGVVALARRTGADADPAIRARIARAWIGLSVMRSHTLRMLAGEPRPYASSVMKVLWSRWHRALGELAMEVRGAAGLLTGGGPDDVDEWQRLFLFSRADTIYGGSDEIQHNIIAQRILGLPR